MKNGFTGGLIIDFPNSNKAKKYFLFLMAGFSKDIADDAEKAIMMPKAREEGEDYSDVSDDESENDSDMQSYDDESKDKSETGSDEDEGMLKKKKQDKIAFLGKRRQSKLIQKAMKKQGRFKANGNRKNKEWILKKKDRQRR